MKLWNQLHEHRKNGTTELTFGTTNPVTVSQMAKTQQTVYVSGALCGFSEVSNAGMDHADYPWDTVPKVVSKIVKSQTWHDQRQRQFRMRHSKEERANLEHWDYMAPIVADGDMGFQSMTSAMKMAREFVDAGVACVHIDDLAIGKLWPDPSTRSQLGTNLFCRYEEVHHWRGSHRSPNIRVP